MFTSSLLVVSAAFAIQQLIILIKKNVSLSRDRCQRRTSPANEHETNSRAAWEHSPVRIFVFFFQLCERAYLRQFTHCPISPPVYILVLLRHEEGRNLKPNYEKSSLVLTRIQSFCIYTGLIFKLSELL